MKDKATEIPLDVVKSLIAAAVVSFLLILYAALKPRKIEVPYKNPRVCVGVFIGDAPKSVDRLQLVPRSDCCSYLLTGWEDGHAEIIEFHAEVNGVFTGQARLASNPGVIVADRVELLVDRSGIGVLTMTDTINEIGRIAEMIVVHAKQRPSADAVRKLMAQHFDLVVAADPNRTATELISQKLLQ